MTTFEKLEELIHKGFKETDERLALHRKELDERYEKERKEREERLEKERKEREERLENERKEREERYELYAKELKERDERIEKERKELDKRIERIHQQFGKELNGVTESLRRFSEQSFYPATRRVFEERGIELSRFYSNLEAEKRNGESWESDIAGLGPKHAVLIEVKLRLRQTDVKEFLEKLPRFFDFFPDFRRPILYGGVAGMSIDKDADRFAYKNGVFILSQTGDNIRILNDEKFLPRSFNTEAENGSSKRKSNPRK